MSGGQLQGPGHRRLICECQYLVILCTIRRLCSQWWASGAIYKLNMNGKFCAQLHRCYFLVSHFTNKIKYWNSDIVTCNNQKCAQYSSFSYYKLDSNLGFFIVGYGPAVARRAGRLPRLTGHIDREALGQRGPGQPVNIVSIKGEITEFFKFDIDVKHRYSLESVYFYIFRI